MTSWFFLSDIRFPTQNFQITFANQSITSSINFFFRFPEKTYILDTFHTQCGQNYNERCLNAYICYNKALSIRMWFPVKSLHSHTHSQIKNLPSTGTSTSIPVLNSIIIRSITLIKQQVLIESITSLTQTYHSCTSTSTQNAAPSYQSSCVQNDDYRKAVVHSLLLHTCTPDL